MKKKNLLFTAVICGTALFTAGVMATQTSNNIFATLGEDAHDWQHYGAVDPTTSSIGHKEYWVCCGCQEMVFTQPTGKVSEGKTSSADILNYLSSNPDSRYLGKKGTLNVPTNSASNWDAVTSGAVRTQFGQSVGSRSNNNLMELRNYQYFDWADTQTLTATYTAQGELVSASTLGFTYYVYQESGKADLTVTLSVVDAGDVKTQIDQFVIDKNAGGWVNYKKDFGLTTVKKFVIETKAEKVELAANSGINTRMFIDALNISAPTTEKGNVAISTTDSTKWSSSAKQSAKNSVYTGTGAWHKPGESVGSYLDVCTYQWQDWNPTDAGLLAIYTNDTPKIVNNLKFAYYLNDSYFKASKLTFKIEVVGAGVTTVIDTIEFVKDSVTFGSVINYSKSFDEVQFDQLRITTSTNEAKGFSGETCVFLKEMSANYVK